MNEKGEREGGVVAAGTGPAAEGQESATDYKAHVLPHGVRRGIYCDDT